MSSSAPTRPSDGQGPPPENFLTYPLYFTSLGEGGGEKENGGAIRHVSLFTALYWLLPVYVLAGWIDRKDPLVAGAVAEMRALAGASREVSEEREVGLAQRLLPLFERFFEEKSRLVPPSAQTLQVVQAVAFPTPKGARSITRLRVEGVEEPPRPDYVQQSPSSLAGAAAPPGLFCLWPHHNQFLVHYEPRERLAAFTYLELDRLRFAFAAVRDLVEEYEVFHRHDGSLTGLAKRDVKKNCSADPRWAVGAAAQEEDGKDAGRDGPAVGRGGGNARLHQGTSGNVVTAPSAESVQQRREQVAKRYLKEELQALCTARWPHTPVAKSCIFVTLEEKKQCDLTGSEPLGVSGGGNATNSKGGKRRGPTYYWVGVELPLLNKKGGTARFRAEKWWTVKADGETDAAEVAIKALQKMK